MIHDLTQCTGHGCPRRDSCLTASELEQIKQPEDKTEYEYTQTELPY